MTTRPKLGWLSLATGLLIAFAVGLAVYLRFNPLVFNESFFGHAHCIKAAGLSLLMWAEDHGGQLPVHPNGCGDALLMMTNYVLVLGPITGPGYDTRIFEEATATKGNVKEELCGRVYVQGLSNTNSGEIAVLFDKLASPGDHLHGFRRLWSPFGREVGYLNGSIQFIPNPEWPVFANKQIMLLEAAGIPRSEGERLYSSIVK